MHDYQRQFIDLALKRGVLKFGRFVLKSGRVSPYFFNAGAFCTGEDLAALGYCYATALERSGVSYDVLFGPAYKGIPLACAAAMSLALNYNRNVPWCFNRKEIKDHGEGGSLVGSGLRGDVMLIDDVITAGTAIRESAEIIKKEGARFKGAIIALDRMEKGRHSDKSAIAEAQEELGVTVISIIGFDDLLSYIKDAPALSEHLGAMVEYRAMYGA